MRARYGERAVPNEPRFVPALGRARYGERAVPNERGNGERALAFRNEAREIVEWLTQHAPAEFQTTFHAQEKVQTLFNS